MTRITLTACVLFLLISTTLGLGFGHFKKIKLEDIERGNTKPKQPPQEDQKPQQQQQVQQKQPAPEPQQQEQQKQPAPEPQQQEKPQPAPAQQQEQPPSAPDYSQQQLSFEQDQHQLLLQHLQAYQSQFQSPHSFLHPGFLGGNNLGIPHELLSFNIPSYPQQFYFPHSGYSGLGFLQAQAPLFYNQHIPIEQPQVSAEKTEAPQSSSAPSSAASAVPEAPAKETASAPTAAASEQSSQPAEQQPQVQKQSEPPKKPESPEIPAEPSFEYTPQKYNPIPKELESYTTIPEAVYQGKDTDYLYDQQIPDVSLTNENFNPYNTLFQQSSQLQRPIFSPGVKSQSSSFKDFPSSTTFFNSNSFLSPTSRHFPSGDLSYSTYRQSDHSPF